MAVEFDKWPPCGSVERGGTSVADDLTNVGRRAGDRCVIAYRPLVSGGPRGAIESEGPPQRAHGDAEGAGGTRNRRQCVGAGERHRGRPGRTVEGADLTPIAHGHAEACGWAGHGGPAVVIVVADGDRRGPGRAVECERCALAVDGGAERGGGTGHCHRAPVTWVDDRCGGKGHGCVGEVVAGVVGDELGGAGGAVGESDLAVLADPDDDEVRDRLPGEEVQVGGVGCAGAVGVDGDEAVPGGIGDGDVEHYGGRPGGGNACGAGDLDGDGAVSGDRAGGAESAAGVQHPGGVEGLEGTGRGGCAGEVVAGDVGDELGGAGGAVGESDLAVRADGDDDEVRDRLPGEEVQVGGVGCAGAVGVDGDEAVPGGTGDGDVEHHGGRPGGGNACGAGDLDGDGAVSGDRAGGAESAAGVQHPGGVQGLEGTGRGGCAGEVVAGDVGDELGGAGGAVGESDLAVRADGDDDEVRDRLPGEEVQVGGIGCAGAFGVDGDKAVPDGTGDGDVEHHGGHPGGGNACGAGDLDGDGAVTGDRAGGAESPAGVQQPGGVQGLEGTGRGGCAGEVVAGDVGDELGGAGGAVGESDLAVRAEGDDDEVRDRLPGEEVQVGGIGCAGAVGVDGDEAVPGGTGDGDVEHHGGRPGGGNACGAGDLDGDGAVSGDRAGGAESPAGVQHPGGVEGLEGTGPVSYTHLTLPTKRIV